MSFFKSATLEFRGWTTQWLVAVVLATFGTFEMRGFGKNFINVFSIVRLVCRNVQ